MTHPTKEKVWEKAFDTFELEEGIVDESNMEHKIQLLKAFISSIEDTARREQKKIDEKELQRATEAASTIAWDMAVSITRSQTRKECVEKIQEMSGYWFNAHEELVETKKGIYIDRLEVIKIIRGEE